MTRYRVLSPFGPWERGMEFESTDEMHARLAEDGKMLQVVEEDEDG